VCGCCRFQRVRTQYLMPQFGQPCPVRATKVSDPSEVHLFKSLSLAQTQIKEWTGTCPHHTTIKRNADNNKEAHGYRWELVTNNEKTVHNDSDIDEEFNGLSDTSIFTFRDCVEAIFNGGKVRVTDEAPKRASVIDIIRIVSNNTSNPSQMWQRIRDNTECAELLTKCYDFKFQGAGQRNTPVTDANGIILLLNLLPGEKARKFRMSAADVLVRFLVGEQSLHDELDDNAARQAHLHPEHPLQMMSEEVYAHPRSSKYVMHSPRMKGKYIGMFYSHPVVYLLQFKHNGKDYIKIGWSDEFRGRMDTHFNELPGCKLYSVFPINNAYRVEHAWKDDFRAYCSPIIVNGKNKTELYIGLDIEEAEDRLNELCEEQRTVYKKDHEFEVMQYRMKHELSLKELELEGQRIQLQILQTQLALKQ